jgi:hypothetical protein
MFNKRWEETYSIYYVGSIAVFLICRDKVSVCKVFTIKSHFTPNHEAY